MSLDVGHDFYCAHKNKWVARSEFNTDVAFYHEPKNETPYMGAPNGECPCIECVETDSIKCQKCDWPRKLFLEKRIELFDRCELCQAVCKVNGKLR